MATYPEQKGQTDRTNQRRAWAEDEGIDPEVVEKMYRDLLSFFIESELNDWKSTKE